MAKTFDLLLNMIQNHILQLLVGLGSYPLSYIHNVSI